MARPDVSITLSNNNLGRSPANEDGIMGFVLSGVAVVGQFALGDIIGPLRSIKDAEAKGITKAYDLANTVMIWHHLQAYFDEQKGTSPCYVMPVAKTVTLAEMADHTLPYAKSLIEGTNGKCRVVGLGRIPDGAYTPTYTAELDSDIKAAVLKAQALVLYERGLHRPFRLLVEGRDFQGSVADLLDLRDNAAGPNANAVGVVLGQDADVAAENAAYANYACLGRVLGRMARIPVQRNIARVKDGPTGVVNAALSDGTLMSAVDDADINLLHDKGYIFLLSYADLAGWYFNNDSAACPIEDDYATLSRGRTIDKAARITYVTYIQEVQNDIEIDATTGKLPEAVAKGLEGIVEAAIGGAMAGEISGVGAFVDSDQNILATDELAVEVSVVPRGMMSSIKVTLGFAVSLVS